MPTQEKAPAFWADDAADAAAARFAHNLICTGITPSGDIHIGNMREVLTGDAVYRSLLSRGAPARFIFLGDTFDALRRVYPFLDADRYQKMTGKPLSEIPCPCGRHESYAAHFLEPFKHALGELGVRAEILLAHEMYARGMYTDAIFTALEKRDAIAEILKNITGKDIDPAWSPVHPKCGACGRITEAEVLGFNRGDASVEYACSCGHKGSANAAAGGAKLTWRVDWPARWKILGVTVEPFGKDHASKGGSYDSGRVLAREIFGYEAPLPMVYEWISLKGQGDMSSSKGNVVSIADMVEVVPPDVLRYMVFRAQPKKSLVFDPSLPMLNLIDELDDPQSKTRDARASALALVTGMGQVGVPFKHLVNIVQIAGANDDDALAIITRGGYAVRDEDALKKRLAYARKWLARYAPEDIRFSKCEDIPKEALEFPPAVKQALLRLAERLSDDMDAEQIHALFYIAPEGGEILDTSRSALRECAERGDEALDTKCAERGGEILEGGEILDTKCAERGDEALGGGEILDTSRSALRECAERGDAPAVAPADLFKAFYIALIGKSRGPRAGWFIKTLGIDFVRERLLTAARSS